MAGFTFPLAAAASLYVVYRERSTAMNRIAYWHSLLVAVAMAGPIMAASCSRTKRRRSVFNASAAANLVVR